jgi:hypothetical protein
MCLWWKKPDLQKIDDGDVSGATKIESVPVEAPASPAGGLDVLGDPFPVKYATKRKSTVRLVIHHVGKLTRDVSAEEIHKWHIDKDYGGIGYHFVIRKNGVIERGRAEDLWGAHCLNQNHDTIGICVVGDFDIQPEVPQAQLYSLKELVDLLCKKYPIKGIYGHRDLKATTCPGKNLYAKVKELVPRYST